MRPPSQSKIFMYIFIVSNSFYRAHSLLLKRYYIPINSIRFIFSAFNGTKYLFNIKKEVLKTDGRKYSSYEALLRPISLISYKKTPFYQLY